MASLQQQLEEINAKIKADEAQAQGLRSSASEWQAQSQIPCTGFHPVFGKKNKAACIADKEMKASKASALNSQATALEDISEHTSMKADISKLITAEATSQVSLASQGLDKTSLKIVAEGTAASALVTAQNISAAQAESLLKTTEVEGKNSEATNKSRNLIFIIIGSVVALGLGVVIFLKVRNGKGKKSKSKR